MQTAERPPVGFKRDGTPQKRANQWTKRKEFSEIPDRDRSRHRADCAAAYLERVMSGKTESNPYRVQAAKALMDKGLPSLQAVEQTVMEAAVNRSEADILNDLREIIKQHPDLIQQLLAEQARAEDNPGPKPVSETQQTEASCA